MTAVECGACRAVVLVAEDVYWEGGDLLDRIVHQPWCRYAASSPEPRA